jgi:putative transposase
VTQNLNAPKKGCGRSVTRHFLQERWQIFGFIKDHRNVFPIEKMCTVFKVNRSRFYTLLNNGLSDTFVENPTLTEITKVIHGNNKHTKPQGHSRINKIGCKGVPSKGCQVDEKGKNKKYCQEEIPCNNRFRAQVFGCRNKLNRQFKVDRIAATWVSDITYIKTRLRAGH